MYCRKQENNTWVCTSDGPRHPVTGKRTQVSRSSKTRKNAEQRVQEALKSLQRNYMLEDKINFLELSKIWFDNYKYRGVKESTLHQREYCIRVLNQYFSRIEVRKISAIAFQNMLNDLNNKEVALSSIKGIKSVAKMIFTYATNIGLISENPCAASFIPRKQLKISDFDTSLIEKKYLNSHELKLFLESVNQYNSLVIKTILYLLAFTGMRPGEAVCLYPDDVDFTNGTIKVNKTTYRKDGIKGSFALTPPKTNSSIRVIEVDEFILDMLKDMMDYQFRRDYKESEYLFRTSDGYPPTVDYLRTVTKRLGEKIELAKPLHTYMLRHTHISLLAEAGVDLPYIMNRVGHKNSKTTTDIYLHVTSGMKEVAKDQMHKKFSELLK